MQRSLNTKLRGINNFSNYRNQLLFKPSYTLHGESLEEPGNCIIDETHHIEFNFQGRGGGGGGIALLCHVTRKALIPHIRYLFSITSEMLKEKCNAKQVDFV